VNVINIKHHFTEEELSFVKKKLPRQKVFKFLNTIRLDDVKLLATEKVYLGQRLKYKNYSENNSNNKKVAENLIKLLTECDDLEINRSYGNSIIKTYNIIQEPIEVYHERLLREGKALIKSHRIKAAWERRKNSRKVLFEKIKKRKKIEKEINTIWLETNYSDADYLIDTNELPF